MKIIKRNGQEVTFNPEKIKNAIKKANGSVLFSEQATELQIDLIATYIETICKEMNRIPSVEEIQDMVEDLLIQFDKQKAACQKVYHIQI